MMLQAHGLLLALAATSVATKSSKHSYCSERYGNCLKATGNKAWCRDLMKDQGCKGGHVADSSWKSAPRSYDVSKKYLFITYLTNIVPHEESFDLIGVNLRPHLDEVVEAKVMQFLSGYTTSDVDVAGFEEDLSSYPGAFEACRLRQSCFTRSFLLKVPESLSPFKYRNTVNKKLEALTASCALCPSVDVLCKLMVSARATVGGRRITTACTNTTNADLRGQPYESFENTMEGDRLYSRVALTVGPGLANLPAQWEWCHVWGDDFYRPHMHADHALLSILALDRTITGLVFNMLAPPVSEAGFKPGDQFVLLFDMALTNWNITFPPYGTVVYNRTRQGEPDNKRWFLISDDEHQTEWCRESVDYLDKQDIGWLDCLAGDKKPSACGGYRASKANMRVESFHSNPSPLMLDSRNSSQPPSLRFTLKYMKGYTGARSIGLNVSFIDVITSVFVPPWQMHIPSVCSSFNQTHFEYVADCSKRGVIEGTIILRKGFMSTIWHNQGRNRILITSTDAKDADVNPLCFVATVAMAVDLETRYNLANDIFIDIATFSKPLESDEASQEVMTTVNTEFGQHE